LFQEIYFRHEATGLSRSNCGNEMLDRVTASRTAHLKEEGLYSEALYYSILYLDPRAERNIWQALRNKQLRSYFQRRKFQELIEAEVEESRERLEQKTKEFILQLRDIMSLRVLDYKEALPVLWRLVNLQPETDLGPFEPGENLDRRLCDAFITEGHDYNYLKVDDYHVIVMGLKSLPKSSRPLLFEGLQKIRGNFHVVTTWKNLPPGLDRKHVQRKKDHFYAQRRRGMRTSEKVGSEGLKDGSKLQAVEDLEALEGGFRRTNTQACIR